MTAHFVISAESMIAASAGAVYRLLADYRQGHPSIVPKKYFGPLQIEAGGVGAGTIIRFNMTVLGTTKTFRMLVAEPRKGQLLTETDMETGSCTSFTVTQHTDPGRCSLCISTQLPQRPGLLGQLERLMTTWLLKRIYAEELGLIRAYFMK